MKPLLVTVQQACDLLGIKKSKLYTLAAAREITVCRIGRTQITMESIEQLIERSVVKSSQKSRRTSAPPLKFWGTLAQLKAIVRETRSPGTWERMLGFWRYRCHDGAILNWWISTGTANLQGPAGEVKTFAAALNRAVLGHSIATRAIAPPDVGDE